MPKSNLLSVRTLWTSETLVLFRTTCWTREPRRPTATVSTTRSAPSLATVTTSSLQIRRAVSQRLQMPDFKEYMQKRGHFVCFFVSYLSWNLRCSWPWPWEHPRGQGTNIQGGEVVRSHPRKVVLWVWSGDNRRDESGLGAPQRPLWHRTGSRWAGLCL